MDQDLIRILERSFAAQQEGRLRVAEAGYLDVLTKDSGNEFALNLMGVLCIEEERYDDAVAYLERALATNARDPETHNNLGLAFKGLHRFRDAARSFEASLQMNPRQPVVLNNLGNALAAVGRHKEAIPVFERAVVLAGDYVEGLYNLAASLKEAARLDDALLVINRAIALQPGRSDLYNSKGEILLQAADYDTAKSCLENAIELDGNLLAKINITTAMKQLGQEQQAIALLEAVLQEEGNNTKAHSHMGVLLEQLGETERAAQSFRRALQYTPNHATSFYQISKMRDQRLTSTEIQKVEELLADPELLDVFRAPLLLAMACEYEKRNEYLTSIDFFVRANRIKAERQPYNGTATIDYLRASKESFPLTHLPLPVTKDELPVPIFIVGMPRSGTTLTEQVIASHSEIKGAGELGFVNELVKLSSQMTGQPFPKSMPALTEAQAKELRERYLQKIITRFGTHRYVVDKNPLNFNFVGFIASIFPEAKILYCGRSPMDTCISIFKLPFDDNQGYSHNLAALGHFYVHHVLLMQHWLRHYSVQILQVEYEQTVADLEAQARRILEFIGVDFEDDVLNFFNNERIVMTPSTQQVRQPIYKTSIDSWQRYGQALEPLITALQIGVAAA